MINEHYAFKSQNLGKLYMFESFGKKHIVKFVQFKLVKENIYNLGLADFQSGRLEFNHLTDNDDVWKVFQTVAAIAISFSETYPNVCIRIRVNEPRRLHLYNRIFANRQGQIEEFFDIYGYIEDSLKVHKPFQSDKSYFGFLICKK